MPYFQGVFGKNYYEVHGEGLPVILIPGMGASHQEWFGQVATLSKHYQIIALDNAGSGRSVHPDFEISIQQMAEDVSRLITHLKLKKVILVGSSMGGVIAQCCLELFPNRIAGIVLSATFAGVNAHLLQVLSPLLRSKLSPKLRINNVLSLLVSEKFIREKPAITRRYVEQAEKYAPPREVFQRQVRALLNFTPHPPKKTQTIPMMILVGSDDPITPPDMAQELQQRFPQATLYVFQGAKHLIHIECAEEFNTQLRNFLGSREWDGV